MSDICSLDGKLWEFTADFARGDTAYTNIALDAHTDNTYFVSERMTFPVLWLRGMPDTLDRSLRTATLPSPFAHGWIRWGDAPSRRILRRVDLESSPPGIILSPLHHPDSGTCDWRRNGDLPTFAEIRVPCFEPRPCNEGVVSGEVE